MNRWVEKLMRLARGFAPRTRRGLVKDLLELSQGLTHSRGLGDWMTHLCHGAVRLLGCDRSTVFLLEEGYYRPRFNHGYPPDIARSFAHLKVDPKDSLIAEAMATGSVVVVNDARRSKIMNPQDTKRARVGAILVAPLLRSEGEPLGFVTADYGENRGTFSQLDVTLLLGIAKLAQLAIENEELAKKDASFEERLRRQEQLEAVSRFAGGLAHDFNNLLTVILATTEALRRDHADPDSAEDLNDLQIAAESAAALSRQLLSFSRGRVRQPTVMQLSRAIRDIEGLLRRFVPEDISLVLDSSDVDGCVQMDRSALEQLVSNLVINACDATPPKGRITVGVQAIEIDSTEAEKLGLKEGPYMQLLVGDTGAGIPEENLDKIFDPLFTTKTEGKGTGLGLSSVLGIVTHCGGAARVNSEVGIGTEFEILLPAVEEGEQASAPQQARPATGESAQSATILLVDDDQTIRRFAARALRGRGFLVLEASDGAEALELARSHDGAIDLLVTDVVMPVMGGRELADALAEQRTDLEVLYVSGYAPESTAGRGVERDRVSFLAKPFTMEALVARVEELLTRHATH